MREMNAMRRLVLLTALIALLALVSVASAGSSASYVLAPDVLAAGGQPASSASYAFVSTLGQPFVGASSSANDAVCSGYWCHLAALYKLMLPVVLRDF
jgi:hypothetical protein